MLLLDPYYISYGYFFQSSALLSTAAKCELLVGQTDPASFVLPLGQQAELAGPETAPLLAELLEEPVGHLGVASRQRLPKFASAATFQ
jgi:hypothetical protein